MGSSGHRRSGLAAAGSRRGRLLIAGAVIVAAGGAIGFAQLSHADETPRTKAGQSGAGKIVNGQQILTDTCVDSRLQAHDGFQKGDRCVSTAFGEVASAANDASLLITQAPAWVAPNTPFTLKVSTRNLIRDRFLAAGQGGYYVESSVLQNGIVRGHFHTACRMLASTREAPDPAPVPAFFVATEDKKGGREPDTVTIQVAGLPTEGVAQCASWAGDGSHRTPMMERANQTPAIDAVRITVRGAGGGNNNGGNQGNNNGGNQGGNNNGGNTGNNNGGNTGGNQGNNNGGNQGGNNNGGGNTSGNTGNNNTGNNTNAGTVTATPKATVKPNPTKGSTGNETTATTKTTIEATTKPTTRPATKPATTKPAKSSDSDSDSSNSSDTSNSSDSSDDNAAPAETKKPKPQATESENTGDAADYGIDVGAPDDAAPTSTSRAGVQLAEPPAGDNSNGGPFALVGEHPAWFGGGAVLVLLATIGFAFSRSRPRRRY